MKINNQIKEIEKGCGRKYSNCYGALTKTCLPDKLCLYCYGRLEILKQFQKEIKAVQGELNKKSLSCVKLNDLPKDILDLVNKREIKVSYMIDNKKISEKFKKRFGEMK